MASKTMIKELNNQINAEAYSAYLYLSMSSDASFKGYKGVANWFFVQAQEEMTHAWRIFNYIGSLGEHAILAAIDGPPVTFASTTAMFEAALKHEKKITAMINKLSDLAVKEKDHAAGDFLLWFVREQVEEEKNVMEILSDLKMAGEQPAALFMLDRDLAARTFVMPPDLGPAAPAAGA